MIMNNPENTIEQIREGTQDIDNSDRVMLRYQIANTLSQSGFGDVLVLSHETVEEVLTPNRREILQTLAKEEIGSVRELADTLDRDYGNVSRDLDALATSDLVTYLENGRSKQPAVKHDSIVVEPLMAPAKAISDLADKTS